jgi:Lrp/AsnC family transcriptional regulator for asnA, asnC and gidA
MANSNNGYVDDLDLEILTQLEADGRKSFTDIANSLNIAVGTVRNRVTRMLANGTVHILGRVNPHHVGFNAPATIVISVQPECLESSVKEIAKFPEVSYIAVLTGQYDVMVDVMCRDARHLTQFLVHRLARVKGVTDFQTQLILEIHKYSQPDLKLLGQHVTSSAGPGRHGTR